MRGVLAADETSLLEGDVGAEVLALGRMTGGGATTIPSGWVTVLIRLACLKSGRWLVIAKEG
jgi:hypothetical protein